jgi:hypothetical protein
MIRLDILACRVVPALAARYPGLQSVYICTSQSRIATDLLNNKCAIGVGIITEQYASLLNYETVGEEEYVLAVPKGHPLERKAHPLPGSRFPHLAVSHLKNTPFVLSRPGAYSTRVAQRFFEAKEEIIAAAVSELCGYFKDKGLIVGLDLFAPLVSRFVGQNYALITKDADFIKPMLYRRTEAPAGIGYEYALFEKHAPAARRPAAPAMDRAFLNTQLEAVAQVSCERYPGIEVNYLEGIAQTDPDYVRESFDTVREFGFEGAVLCWNVMEAPDEHIEAIAELAKVPPRDSGGTEA